MTRVDPDELQSTHQLRVRAHSWVKSARSHRAQLGWAGPDIVERLASLPVAGAAESPKARWKAQPQMSLETEYEIAQVTD